jgi:signal peptidase I
MPLSQEFPGEAAAIASLYIEAVRRGQSLWFRVASGSMHPTLRIGEQVRIEPARAEQLCVGEIAAFETAQGLTIHRVVQRRHDGASTQLVEMSDVHLRASHLNERVVVGRVVAIRREKRYIDLRRPIAKKCGAVTAFARFRSYQIHTHNKFTLFVLSKCSRIIVHICSWCVRLCCSSSISDVPAQSLDD